MQLTKQVIVRNFLLFHIIIFHSYLAHSQLVSNSIQVSAGVNYGNATQYDQSFITGYRIGIYHLQQLSNPRLLFKTGIAIDKKGLDFMSNDLRFNYNFHQAVLPASITYEILSRFYAHVGIFGGINFGKKLDYKAGSYRLSHSSIINIPDYQPFDELNDLEWGISAGVGLKLGQNWSISFGVFNALSTLYNRENEHKILMISNQNIIDLSSDVRRRLDDQLIHSKSVHFSLEVQRVLFSRKRQTGYR